jgi:amino acid adenylation domain-containing protein
MARQPTMNMFPADGADVTSRLLAIAARAPHSPAILAPGREALSYSALAAHADRTAAQLASWGIGHGDIVAWANGERAETAVALAVLPASSTIAPLNPASTFDVLCDLLARMRPKAVVVPADGDSAILRAARRHGVAEITTARGAGAMAGAFDLALVRPAVSLDSAPRARDHWACLVATSGSTGRPKIVPLAHRQIMVTAHAIGERLAIGPGDVSGHIMPFHLSGGVRNPYYQALLNGGAVNVLPLADVEAFVAEVAAGRVTWLSASFTMMRELLARHGDGRRFDRGRLRFVRVASGRLEADEMDRLERVLGVPVITGLASSETGTTAQQRLPPAPRKRGSVGPLVECEVRLVDDRGDIAADGEIGEIQVRGPQVFEGYFDDPDLDAASFVDGWFRMGDLARFDDDGELHLVGRVKEVINRGGDKIAPLEVERVLRAIPGVADAAAFGIPHPRLGEEVVAAVVPSPGALIAADAVLERAREVLGANRAPRRVWFVASLPRTDGGKIRRNELPAWVGYDASGEAAAPDAVPVAGASPTAIALAALWANLLGVRFVPHDADFFMLGGDSLRGAQLVDQVLALFGVSIPANALFGDVGTVAAMARHIEAQRRATPSSPRSPTIPRRAAGLPVPLSSAQLRVWFLHRLDPTGAAYNEARLWRVDGALDVVALRTALAAVAVRQPMLRTRFVVSGAHPQQVASTHPHVILETVPLPGAADDEEARLGRAVRENAARPFDLAAAPPIRWTLYGLGPERFALLRVWHHILGDGLSSGLLQKELSEAYAAARRGRAVSLPPLTVDFADYAIWQAEPADPARRADDLAYWKTHLADLPVLALPADRSRPPAQSFRGGVVTTRLADDAVAALKAIGRRHDATPFVTFLAAFSALLSRLSGDEDLAIGTPVVGRSLPELADVIGFFANTLVFRADLSGQPSAGELIARTRDRVRAMLAHDGIAFETLVDAIGMPRDPSRNPLFQVAFALRGRDPVELRLQDAQVRRVETGIERAKFDLTLSMIDSPDGLDARWEFCADLFERATIERMAHQFETLVAALASAPDRPVTMLPLMDDATRGRILDAATATARAYPDAMTIHQRFAEQVRANPGAPAIDSFDYEELEAAANRLARELRAQGAGAGDFVAVARVRCVDVVVAWLAVLKAGAAYLPIDPELPPERLAFLLADARVAYAIADDGLEARLAGPAMRVLCPDREAVRIAAWAADAPEDGARAGDPAYVIYTSGSTGTPKGVVVPHRAVLRLVCGTDCAQLVPKDTVAQLANPAFDASTFEIWGALLNGARLVPLAKATAIAPRALAAALVRERVTALFLTTALFNAVAREVPDAFRGCRCVLFGGEAVEPRWVAEVLRAGPPRHLLHVYGPTEATTFATWHEVRGVAAEATTVPIGRPLANTEVFVLRPDFEPAAPGEPGEICIGGPGLALGYLNPTERLAGRFVERSVATLCPRRLYRTGDRARWRDDGTIEFLGRVDTQVKLRGHRVELEEIEAAIARLPQVRAAVVALQGSTTDTRRLVAYVVPADTSGPPPANLWRDLRPILPDYMLPASIVWLPSLPLNASGKVDRRALPAPSDAATPRSGARVRPRDMFEHVLVRIWERVLGVAEVGVFDHFFEIGGHSLLAARLFDEIERETGLAAPLTALFVDDTIAGLALVLRKGAPDLDGPVLAIHDQGALPPFVFLHGDFTGGGFYSRALAHALGPDQPTLIVHPHGLVDIAVPETIEAMAADRIRALRAIRPHGPYVLGGHCNGALVAFEMARQLLQEGEDVPAVLMIESRAPSGSASAAAPEAGETYMTLDRSGTARALAPRDRISDMQLRYSRAMDRYAGGPCATHVVVVRSRKLDDARPDLGWLRLAASGEVHVLPGDHVTLITQHVAELARVARGAIDRSLERAKA